jgi:hypothetical protein
MSFKNSSKSKKLKAGYVLLLTILVISTLMVSSLALARLVILNLRQIQYLDRAIVASSAAFSALEKSLFLLRKTEKDILPEISEEEEVGQAKGQGKISFVEQPSFRILKNDFVVLNLPAEIDIDTLKILPWTPQKDCLSSWIEVSKFSWDSQNGFSSSWRQPYSLDSFRSDNSSILIPFSEEEKNKIKQIRVKALSCDILKLEIVGLKGEKPRPLPSQVVITGIGEYLGFKKAFQMITLTQPPLAGFFDFVLFSDSPLVK